MNWSDAEYVVKRWDKPFAIKGVMSVEDAKRAVDIGCTAIMISNHGGRQLDGLSAGGQKGVEKLLQNMHDEIQRNMILMGCKNLKDLNYSRLIFRR